MATKQAKIKCPHCGEPITIRQLDKVAAAEFEAAVKPIWDAADNVWKAMDDAFKKIFK